MLSIPKKNISESDKKGRKRTPKFSNWDIWKWWLKKHDILEKIASLYRELTRKHYIPMGNLQVIEALFDKWFGDTDNRNTDVPVCPC